MEEEDFLITGCLKIKLNNNITVSIYSEGYSYADIEEAKDNEHRLKPHFDNPKLLDKYIEDKNKIVQDFKGFNYEVDEGIFKDFENKAIGVIRESITLGNDCNDIEIYEPPLGFKVVWEDGQQKRKIIIEKDKAIKLSLSGMQNSENPFSTPCINLMENASYYIFIEQNNKEKKNFDIRFPIGVERGYITPYKGTQNGWTINFGNQLFYGNIEILEIDTSGEKKEKVLINIPILVYPKKLDIKKAAEIIKELLEWHSQLIYDFEPTYLSIRPGEYERKHPIQQLNYIKTLFKKRNLKGILNSIIGNPHKVLIKEEILKEIQDVETPVCHRLPELITENGAIRKTSSNSHHFKVGTENYQFLKVYEENSKIIYDTYPNRFIKFFLKFLRQELVNIEKRMHFLIANEKEKTSLRKYFDWILNGISPSVREMKKSINIILNHDFFKEVTDLRFFTAPSITLLKDHRYQQVFSAYLDLIKGVKFSDRLDEFLRDPIKNMPELYEYWCFLKLWKILEERLKAQRKISITFQEKGIDAEIKYGSEIQFENKKAILAYNKYYGKQSDSFISYSVPLRPDISLEVGKMLILFDAKYRVEWIDEIKQIDKDKDKELERIETSERRGTYVLGDIYKMHTYREAILRKEGKNKPLWVIALYPGDEPKLFPEDKQEKIEIENIYQFIDKILNDELKVGGVGAIPLKPGEDN
jgi:predicted component of viral defense system (DUF524 family)